MRSESRRAVDADSAMWKSSAMSSQVFAIPEASPQMSKMNVGGVKIAMNGRVSRASFQEAMLRSAGMANNVCVVRSAGIVSQDSIVVQNMYCLFSYRVI